MVVVPASATTTHSSAQEGLFATSRNSTRTGEHQRRFGGDEHVVVHFVLEGGAPGPPIMSSKVSVIHTTSRPLNEPFAVCAAKRRGVGSAHLTIPTLDGMKHLVGHRLLNLRIGSEAVPVRVQGNATGTIDAGIPGVIDGHRKVPEEDLCKRTEPGKRKPHLEELPVADLIEHEGDGHRLVGGKEVAGNDRVETI